MKRFAFEKNGFHTFEYTQPNRKKQRMQNIMAAVFRGGKSAHRKFVSLEGRHGEEKDTREQKEEQETKR